MSHSPYPVSSDFGPRASGFHTGVDFKTPVGTPLGAPFAGVADVRKLATSYGWHVWVRSGDDEYLAAHLSKILVTDGERVYAGQPIGETGGEPGQPGSGNSTGSHVHYEWRTSGTARNPINQLGQLFHPTTYIEEDEVVLIRIGGTATVWACLWGFKVAVPSPTVLEKMGGSFDDVKGVNGQHPLAMLPTLDAAGLARHLAAGPPTHG